MIYVCPNCGYSLSNPVKDGIAICSNCCCLFDSSQQSKLLSAAWIARKKNYTFEQLVKKLALNNDEAKFIHEKVVIESLTHDELFDYLHENKVANRCYLPSLTLT